MMSKPFTLCKKISINFFILCILLIPFINKIDAHPIHGDEIGWLLSTKFFTLFFIDHDISNEQWKKAFSYDQPPVGRYIIGFALTIAGYGNNLKELDNLTWDYTKSEDWNKKYGTMPSDDILYVGRLTMALFGSFTCFLIYWIGKKIFEPRVGIIASLLLAFNPGILLWSPRVMTDALLLFFLTANLSLLIIFYKNFLKRNYKKTLFFAIAIGINTFLAAGTKLNGSLAGLIFTGFCIFILLIRILQQKFSHDPYISNKTDIEGKVVFGSIVLSCCIALFLFIIVNPFLYENPIKGMTTMIGYRMTAHPYALNSFGKKVTFVIQQVFFSENFALLKNIFKLPIDFCLFLLGFLIILYTEATYIIRGHHPSLNSIILVWTCITFAGIITWIPINWDRYCLPIIPCIAMITGYALSVIIETPWKIITKLIKPA